MDYVKLNERINEKSKEIKIVAITGGPSSGKTTLLNCLRGKVIGGISYNEIAKEAKKLFKRDFDESERVIVEIKLSQGCLITGEVALGVIEVLKGKISDVEKFQKLIAIIQTYLDERAIDYCIENGIDTIIQDRSIVDGEAYLRVKKIRNEELFRIYSAGSERISYAILLKHPKNFEKEVNDLTRIEKSLEEALEIEREIEKVYKKYGIKMYKLNPYWNELNEKVRKLKQILKQG